LWSAVFVLTAARGAWAEEGKVTLPVSLWGQMLSELENSTKADRPSIGVLAIERRVEGELKKGLLAAILTTRFEVLDQQSGHVRVPILDAGASIGDVRLNGQKTSLLKEGSMYTVGIDRPGIYTLETRFYWGREQDRFARRLRFALPEGGPTHLAVVVPESDIEAQLATGVVTGKERRGTGTLLTGQIDASGLVELSWSRKLSHRTAQTAHTEAHLNALFTAHEAVMEGVATFDFTITEGETDRLDLQLAPDIEVVNVIGDAVLQWYTDANNGGRLVVLLRYLVANRTGITVRFQFPLEAQKAAHLELPFVSPGTSVAGVLGVQAPTGLSVQVAQVQNAQPMDLGDLPRKLTSMTSNPILYGFSFSALPQVSVTISRNESVELISTLIDEVQASTVLIEDGTERTKVQLRVRNNTRQYLRAVLPVGAVLTHSLIDGQPVRPALSPQDKQALLFPLRQSERIARGEKVTHTVVSGETLSDIANFYYSDPGAWQAILNENRGEMTHGAMLQPGQVLRIPAKTGSLEETSFIIELAYERKRARLGTLGHESVSLPTFDVDAMQATWHLYLPEAITPLSFHSNLTQYSAIRYDPFRRVRDFVRRALWERDAWAGSKYQNILSQRRVIYKAEADRKEAGKMVLATFPLSGARYRFKRVLLSRDPAWASFTYVARGIAPWVHWGTFLVAFALTLALLRNSDRRRWLRAGAALAALLVIGYFVLGVHRRILWGIDLALAVQLAPPYLRSAWMSVKTLPERARGMSWRTFGLAVIVLLGLALILLFPLLLSTAALVALLVVWWQKQVRAEVAHA